MASRFYFFINEDCRILQRKRFGEADTDDSYSSNRYRFKLHINSIVLQMRLDKQSVLLYNKSNVGLSNIIK